MRDEIDILMRFYEDQAETARHAESQRATMANLIVTISLAAFGFIGFQRFALGTLPVALFLSLLGLFGIVASMKLYERHQFHSDRSKAFRERLDSLCAEAGIMSVVKKSRDKHLENFPETRLRALALQTHLHTIWNFLHGGITLLGLACVVTIIVKNF